MIEKCLIWNYGMFFYFLFLFIIFQLNAVHELQLLEMICSSLQEAPEQSRYNIFSAIFGGHVDSVKINLLSKLVSMAISISCAAVLGCAALWMQVYTY